MLWPPCECHLNRLTLFDLLSDHERSPSKDINDPAPPPCPPSEMILHPPGSLEHRYNLLQTKKRRAPAEQSCSK